MSNKANPMVIGGFVLGALALMVVAILVFSTGALFRSSDKIVSYFPGTVQGLRVGAAVEYLGVQIGQVTDIKLDFFGEDKDIEVPVFYEMWPDRLRVVQGEFDPDRAASYQLAIEKLGLRAQLTSVSLVTGQYVVSLVNAPNAKVVMRSEGLNTGYIEIPTIEATRDRIADMLKGLDLNGLVTKATDALDGVKALVTDPQLKALAGNANQLLDKTQKLITDVDAGVTPVLGQADVTLKDYSQLAKDLTSRVDTLAGGLETTLADISTLSTNLNAQVGPVSQSARGALGNASKAFRSVDEMVNTESSTRYDLDLLLREGASAARALRLLADYLEQNPDALIKGRY